VPHDVERDVDERDEDVADSQVGDEHIGDAVKPTMSPNDVADERVGEQRDTEDDEVRHAKKRHFRAWPQLQ